MRSGDGGGFGASDAGSCGVVAAGAGGSLGGIGRYVVVVVVVVVVAVAVVVLALDASLLYLNNYCMPHLEMFPCVCVFYSTGSSSASPLMAACGSHDYPTSMVCCGVVRRAMHWFAAVFF